ncbi:MAG: SHOCT domain-containing protein [Thermoplasmata archaeon]|jgi:putative membrane protein|nr:SHOCT domain-containing protein [Thermoplasmata archaeon]
MNQGSTAYPPPHHEEGHHWISIGIAIMLAFIGLAVLLSVAFPGGMMHNGGPGFMVGWGWGWVWGIFWLIIFLWIIGWLIRGAMWTGGAWGYHASRHYRRYNGWDPASQILRERYARGELNRDQFDQMMRDLETRGR